MKFSVVVHYREIWMGVVVFAKVQGLVKSESPRTFTDSIIWLSKLVWNCLCEISYFQEHQWRWPDHWNLSAHDPQSCQYILDVFTPWSYFSQRTHEKWSDQSGSIILFTKLSLDEFVLDHSFVRCLPCVVVCPPAKWVTTLKSLSNS